MPITAREALEIAERHGLGLHDAAALQALADNASEAKEVAARFGKATATLTTRDRAAAIVEAITR